MKKLFLLLFAALVISSATAQKVYSFRSSTKNGTLVLVPIDSMDRVDLRGADNLTIKHYKTPLTIEAVKSLVSFPKQSEIYRSLTGLCDLWYDMARHEGKTDEQAAEIALVKLGEKVGEMAKW